MSVSRGASDSYVTLAPRQQAIGMWARIQQVSDSKWWAHLRSFATSFQSLVNFHKWNSYHGLVQFMKKNAACRSPSLGWRSWSAAHGVVAALHRRTLPCASMLCKGKVSETVPVHRALSRHRVTLTPCQYALGTWGQGRLLVNNNVCRPFFHVPRACWRGARMTRCPVVPAQGKIDRYNWGGCCGIRFFAKIDALAAFHVSASNRCGQGQS
jgi:hypothetical protein